MLFTTLNICKKFKNKQIFHYDSIKKFYKMQLCIFN